MNNFFKKNANLTKKNNNKERREILAKAFGNSKTLYEKEENCFPESTSLIIFSILT